MKNNLQKKIIKNLNLSKKNIIEQPLRALKRINIEKLTKITALAVVDTFKNFKVKIKQKELNKIKLLKKEKINELKKEKSEEKKQKLSELKQIKINALNKLKEEKKIVEDQEKQKLKIIRHQKQIEKQKIKLEAKKLKVEEQKLKDENEKKQRADVLHFMIEVISFTSSLTNTGKN